MVEDRKGIRRPIKDVYIPEKDENISTREVKYSRKKLRCRSVRTCMCEYIFLFLQWMRKYSIAKLKLDLNQLAGGAECSHSKSKVSSLHKTVPAR